MFTRLRNLPAKTKAMIQGLSFAIPAGLAAIVMFYGTSKWPHGPIKEVGGRYLDKVGSSVTEQTYSDYWHWENYLTIGIVGAFVSLLVVSWVIDQPIPIRGASSKKPF